MILNLYHKKYHSRFKIWGFLTLSRYRLCNLSSHVQAILINFNLHKDALLFGNCLPQLADLHFFDLFRVVLYVLAFVLDYKRSP